MPESNRKITLGAPHASGGRQPSTSDTPFILIDKNVGKKRPCRCSPVPCNGSSRTAQHGRAER